MLIINYRNGFQSHFYSDGFGTLLTLLNTLENKFATYENDIPGKLLRVVPRNAKISYIIVSRPDPIFCNNVTINVKKLIIILKILPDDPKINFINALIIDNKTSTKVYKLAKINFPINIINSYTILNIDAPEPNTNFTNKSI